ncbi:unnamed protein product [Toxocara canis]|uniref:Peptidase A1 domain-containing protein n=1 Tax=Toxocara canis TaxID=6265 RepID=A0A183U814_TOXCA|nr:unnamed protein product [Toxocara canis]
MTPLLSVTCFSLKSQFSETVVLVDAGVERIIDFVGVVQGREGVAGLEKDTVEMDGGAHGGFFGFGATIGLSFSSRQRFSDNCISTSMLCKNNFIKKMCT